jgi:hypothetical protein
MFTEIRAKLKKYAIEIKYLKSKRKLSNRGNLSLSDIQSDLLKLKYEFRHNHIAYCELRGRTRERIEIPSEFNLPNEDYIKKIKKVILQKIEDEKIIHSCAL